jgi:hypothetical protein
MADLQARGYDGVVCLEYTGGTWMSPRPIDCLTETVALRDELRGYLRWT